MSSRGHDRERAVKKLLEKDGYVVVRAAGSMGTVDLVALRGWPCADVETGAEARATTARLIEVKSTLTPYAHFSPAEREELRALADACGASAWLAWWPSRGTLSWIPSRDWPA